MICLIFGSLVRTARLHDLSGGQRQGQGCNFEAQNRFSIARRWYHQAAMHGFVLCFGSTIAGTLRYYGLGQPAPHGLLSLPKLLGVPRGLLLGIGGAGLAWSKTRADPRLGAVNVWGVELALILLLTWVGASGLILFALTGDPLVPFLLALHLASLLALFLLAPFSKLVHGFYRLVVLIRDAQKHARRVPPARSPDAR